MNEFQSKNILFMEKPGKIFENIHKEKLLSLGREDLLRIISQKNEKIKRLEDLITKTMNINVDLERKLKVLKKETVAKKGISYNQKWSWVIKIIFCLKENNRPMKSQEIISYLQQYDDTIQSWQNKLKSFSANLTKSVGYGRIVQHKLKGIHGYYYLLPEWFDEDRKIKYEYLSRINLMA